MKQLQNVLYITGKDLKLFTRDRAALFFFVLFPILFITMFTFLNIGASEDYRLKLHLVTEEADGGLSHRIISAMETREDSQLKPGEPEIVWLEDSDEARRLVEDKEIAGYLAFPEDFTEGVSMGYGAQLEVVADAEAINEQAAINGFARTIASRVGSQQVVAGAAIALLVEQGLADPAEMADIGRVIQQLFSANGDGDSGVSIVDFQTQVVGEVEAENAANWAVSGYLVMFVFFAAALSAEAIVRERQNNTLERLLSSSVRPEAILGGMFTGTAVKGLIQIVIFWTVGILAFNVDLGLAPGAVILLSILMVIMSAAFGIMLATLVRTQRSAGSVAVLASLILAPLGGCWWPLFILPRWMQGLAKITPHGWANTGFNKLLLFGADFNAVVPEMLVIAGFAMVFGVIAAWRFRTSAT